MKHFLKVLAIVPVRNREQGNTFSFYLLLQINKLNYRQ